MSKGKGKKQFQGAGRRFRADIWLDEKVSGRTMHALQERGVAAIYGPGTPMLDSVRDVLNLISQHHD